MTENKGWTLVSTGYAQGWHPFIPYIMPAGSLEGNVAAVTLDASSRSSLKWQVPAYTQPWVLWELMSDLFPHPEEMAILSFELAIDHLIETLVPHHPTFGILLYKGLPLADYTLIRSLAARLPEEILPLVALDLTGSVSFFHALRREELPQIGLIVKGSPSPYTQPALGWGSPSPYGSYECVEPMASQRLPAALCYGPTATFSLPSEPCRVIPEALLCEEWAGVDRLYTVGLTPLGERAVSGFCAAGGEIIEIQCGGEELLPL